MERLRDHFIFILLAFLVCQDYTVAESDSSTSPVTYKKSQQSRETTRKSYTNSNPPESNTAYEEKKVKSVSSSDPNESLYEEQIQYSASQNDGSNRNIDRKANKPSKDSEQRFKPKSSRCPHSKRRNQPAGKTKNLESSKQQHTLSRRAYDEDNGQVEEEQLSLLEQDDNDQLEEERNEKEKEEEEEEEEGEEEEEEEKFSETPFEQEGIDQLEEDEVLETSTESPLNFGASENQINRQSSPSQFRFPFRMTENMELPPVRQQQQGPSRNSPFQFPTQSSLTSFQQTPQYQFNGLPNQSGRSFFPPPPPPYQNGRHFPPPDYFPSEDFPFDWPPHQCPQKRFGEPRNPSERNFQMQQQGPMKFQNYRFDQESPFPRFPLPPPRRSGQTQQNQQHQGPPFGNSQSGSKSGPPRFPSSFRSQEQQPSSFQESEN